MTWLVAYTASQFSEERLVQGCQRLGIEAYCPAEVIFVSHARKRYARTRPLFRKYVFVNARDGFDMYRIREVLGVAYFLGHPGPAKAAAPEVIESLRQAEAAGLFDRTRARSEPRRLPKGDPNSPFAILTEKLWAASQRRREQLLLSSLRVAA